MCITSSSPAARPLRARKSTCCSMGVRIFFLRVFLLLHVFVLCFPEMPSELPSLVEFVVLLVFVGCEHSGYVVLVFLGFFAERAAEVRWVEVSLLLIGFTGTGSTFCGFVRRCGFATPTICFSSCS